MTEDQIRRVFVRLLGGPPRAADIAVCQMMGGEPDVVADYIWDHWMGEPDSPTNEEVLAVVREEAAK